MPDEEAKMSSQALASKSLIGIVRKASLADAARLMVDKNIGALGVCSVDQHELLGVITERDIMRAVARGLDPTHTGVLEAMSHSPLVAEGAITRAGAAEVMRKGHVRHLIIKRDGSDRIVSIRDL